MSDKQIHAIVKGRVQGVYFRRSTLDVATRLGLRGTVRNLPDESVEIVVAGPPPVIDELLAWAKQGPPAARVDEVVVSELPLDPRLGAFSIR